VQRFCNALSISAGTPPSSRDDFTGRPMRHGITIGMDGKGRCIDNIFVERLWRSLKYEEGLPPCSYECGRCPGRYRRSR
jgi:transposase InsO family protein